MPTLYPKMFDRARGGMGKGEHRLFFGDLGKSVTSLFTDSEYEVVGETARTAAQEAALAAGASPSEARAAGVAAGRAAYEARRAQTSTPRTTVQATEEDVQLVRDVFATEALRRNAALVADAYLATVECAGPWPAV